MERARHANQSAGGVRQSHDVKVEAGDALREREAIKRI